MIRNLAAGVQAFTSNAFLVVGERTVLVDAGANFDVVSRIREQIDQSEGVRRPEAVILTHTHPDHVGNVGEIRDAFGVETWGFDPEQPATDNPIADGETLRMGDHEYLAVHTPGHKNDHLCFYAEGGVLFSGDLIFQNGSFGRTDLPEGDRDLLIESIDRVKYVVGRGLTEFHPGHGPSVFEEPFLHVERASQAARLY